MCKISKYANLSDFIIVGDVDTSRHTRASKGENIEATENIEVVGKYIVIHLSSVDVIQDQIQDTL